MGRDIISEYRENENRTQLRASREMAASVMQMATSTTTYSAIPCPDSSLSPPRKRRAKRPIAAFPLSTMVSPLINANASRKLRSKPCWFGIVSHHLPDTSAGSAAPQPSVLVAIIVAISVGSRRPSTKMTIEITTEMHRRSAVRRAVAGLALKPKLRLAACPSQSLSRRRAVSCRLRLPAPSPCGASGKPHRQQQRRAPPRSRIRRSCL